LGQSAFFLSQPNQEGITVMRSILFTALLVGALAFINPVPAHSGRVAVVNESNYCYQLDIKSYILSIDSLFKWVELPTSCLLVKERSTNVYDGVIDSVFEIRTFVSDGCADKHCVSSSASRRIWKKEQDELRPSPSRTFKVTIDKNQNATVTIVRN
jgi:hypothetical protein